MSVTFPPNSTCFALCTVVAVCVTPAMASPDGDSCRREICNGAVVSCMGADQQLNPFAGTADEKKTYCAQFFDGCMKRNIVADLPWYSPETVARFLRCPS